MIIKRFFVIYSYHTVFFCAAVSCALYNKDHRKRTQDKSRAEMSRRDSHPHRAFDIPCTYGKNPLGNFRNEGNKAHWLTPFFPHSVQGLSTVFTSLKIKKVRQQSQRTKNANSKSLNHHNISYPKASIHMRNLHFIKLSMY